jgi:hypothetical protein
MSAVRYAVSAFALILFAVACSDDSPNIANADGIAVREARVASADMSVSGATPDSATQDTTLDVVINGSGFVAGTAANWALAGVQDPAQVRTNSTRYVNSRQLVANITISNSAAIAKWDIVVTATGKKGGIGSEAFTIKAKHNVDTNSQVNYVVADQVDLALPGAPPDLHPAGIRGDGRLKDGSSANGADAEYQTNLCGAQGHIANMPDPNGVAGTGDLSFDPDNGTNYCGAARYFSMNLDGVLTRVTPLSRVFSLWSIGVGATVTTTEGFGVQLPNCSVLKFDSAYGSDNILVTRLDDGIGPRRWLLKSQGSHMAACLVQSKKGPATMIATGKKYFLPFAITITEIPYPYAANP